MNDDKVIVLFDGVCNFCNSWVNLIIRNDSKDKFRFAALQSEAGQRLLAGSKASSLNPESVVVIEKGKYYFRSAAALRISYHMDGLWKLAKVFIILPAFFRNRIYDYVARNRYRWFGKREICMVPDEKVRGKFLK